MSHAENLTERGRGHQYIKYFIQINLSNMLLYHQKMINSILKVPIVAHNARHFYLIFLLKNKRDVQREK